MKTTFLFFLLILTAGLPVLAQTTRYVSTTGTNSNPASATSWATSTTNLQGAIENSASGDQVWVATGTYKPTTSTDRTISFSMKNGVTIYGGFVGSETVLNQRPVINPVSGQPSNTTLSGDIGTVGLNSDNSYHVFYNYPSSLNGSAVLDGFIITGAYADGSSIFPPYPGYGGGMYTMRGSPTVRNCSFQGNVAFLGGGMYNHGENGTSSPVVTNCVFQSNSVASAGGGMYNDGNNGTSNPLVTNCLFKENSAAGAGGGMYNLGYGFLAEAGTSSPVVTNCSFQSNSALTGGGMANYGWSAQTAGTGTSNPVITNCSFQSNWAAFGGGMANSALASNGTGTSSPVITNCSFQANSAVYFGGGMANEGNVSGTSSPVLTNCVLFDNGGANTFFPNGTTVTATYSLLEPSSLTVGVDVSGPGNLTTTTSPFASTASVALSAGSPAIDQGNSLSYTNAGGPTTDLVGNPRLVGTNCQIDMGAVEFQQTGSTIKSSLSIQTQPVAGSTVCVGSPLTVSVSVTGSVSSYQWYKGSSPVVSQTTATLSLTNVTPADAGSYSVVVTGDCNSVTSTAFSLTVSALPSVTVTAAPSATLSCANPSLTLTAQTSATVFAWSNSGSTGQTLPVSQTGVYSVTVSNGNGCSVVSNSLSILENNTRPTVSVSAVSSILTCAQPTLTLTATSSMTALRWSTGETTATISVSTIGPYSVTATAANGCTAVSNSLTISQNVSLPPFTISSATLCPGQMGNLIASGCTGQVQWSNGATTFMITLTAGSSTSLLTATCTVGTCSTTASGQVIVGGIQPPPAQILTFTADESACPVRLIGRGVASSFTMTGPGNALPQGYVFSTVYRQGGLHDAIGLNIKQPGTYTLTVTYTNSCGTSAPVTRMVTVARSCP